MQLEQIQTSPFTKTFADMFKQVAWSHLLQPLHCFILSFCLYLLLQMQYKLCVAVAFVASFPGEEVALLSTGNGLNLSSSSDFNRCCHIASCFQRSIEGSCSLHNAVATANENAPHASQPSCSCIAMLLMVTVSFSEWMISLIRSITVCGMEDRAFAVIQQHSCLVFIQFYAYCIQWFDRICII